MVVNCNRYLYAWNGWIVKNRRLRSNDNKLHRNEHVTVYGTCWCVYNLTWVFLVVCDNLLCYLCWIHIRFLIIIVKDIIIQSVLNKISVGKSFLLYIGLILLLKIHLFFLLFYQMINLSLMVLGLILYYRV